MTRDREINSNAKILSLPGSVLDELWRMRYPEEGGTKFAFDAILVWLQSEHGVESSMAGLSYALKRMRLERRWDGYAASAERAKALRATQNPKETLADLEAFGTSVFISEAIEDEDRANFVKLRSLTQKDTELAIKQTESAQKDRLLAQKDKIIAQNERRLRILEKKAKKQADAEAALKGIQKDTKLTPEQQREAMVAKMDEFFGLTKAK